MILNMKQLCLFLAPEGFMSSPLAGKRDKVVTILVRCMCVRPCARPNLNLYNNARISKHFGTVVAFEEEKCHLKQFLVC